VDNIKGRTVTALIHRQNECYTLGTSVLRVTCLICLLGFAANCTTDPENNPPVASFVVNPEFGFIDTEFRFDASECSDPEEDVRNLQVRWDWESDGEWDTLWGNSKLRSHCFEQAGTYMVTLEVRDSWGETDSIDLEVQVYWYPERSTGL